MAAEEASTAPVVEGSIAVVEGSTTVAADIVVAVFTAAQDLTADLTAEAVPTEAEVSVADRRRVTTTEPAGVHTAGSAHRAASAGEAAVFSPAAVPLRSDIIRRIFIPQSTTGNGIRSATRATPRVSAEDAARETSRPPTFPIITAEAWEAVGTALAHPEPHLQAGRWAQGRLRDRGRCVTASAARTSGDPLSPIHLSPDLTSAIPASELLRTGDSDRTLVSGVARASIPLAAATDLATGDGATALAGAVTAIEALADMATAGGEAIGPATVGVAAFS